jgi:hypothetical protein
MSSFKRKLKYLFKKIPDPSTGVITGEKIQLLCDHFIGNDEHISKNPLLWRKKYKWIHFEDLNESFNNRPRVFCYTDALWNLDLLIEKLKWLKNPFLLVFHSSDASFTEDHLKLFEKLPNLKKIFSQNVDVYHEKVIPLPIGMANKQFAHGNLALFNDVRKQKFQKKNLVYFNFSIKNNKEKRQECYRKISNKGLEFQSHIPLENYFKSLSTYKFAICPEGNGIDTYRFWECLYLQVVPICKQNLLTKYFAQDFPVILLDDWDDLNISSLDQAYDSFSWNDLPKLDMRYYKELFML